MCFHSFISRNRQDYAPSRGSEGESVSLPFLHLGGHLHSLAYGPFHLQSHWCSYIALLQLPLPLTSLSLILTPLPPTYKDPSNYTGPTWTIQDNFFFKKIHNIITHVKFVLPCKGTYSQVPGNNRI
uniref:Uncharacterized protein n=1 Tax=Rousettus aegyptiacus TaxID=9407 RepID=A0A7J8BEZ0_ROUAE|nr:hypothetical protein HJG63_009692 [Rousettus aegyptiacus]